jgi:hypothetical protein
VPHTRNSFLHITEKSLLLPQPEHATTTPDKNNLQLPKCNNRELEKLVNARDVVRNGSAFTSAS